MRRWRELVTERVRRLLKTMGTGSRALRVEFRYGGEEFTAIIFRLVYHVPKDGIVEFHSLTEIRLYSKSKLRKFQKLIESVLSTTGTRLDSEEKSTYEVLTIIQHYVSSRYSAYAYYWVWGLRKYKSKLPALLDKVIDQVKRSLR